MGGAPPHGRHLQRSTVTDDVHTVRLEALKEFTETHNPAIMATVLLILGTTLAASGLATLTN